MKTSTRAVIQDLGLTVIIGRSGTFELSITILAGSAPHDGATNTFLCEVLATENGKACSVRAAHEVSLFGPGLEQR